MSYRRVNISMFSHHMAIIVRFGLAHSWIWDAHRHRAGGEVLLDRDNERGKKTTVNRNSKKSNIAHTVFLKEEIASIVPEVGAVNPMRYHHGDALGMDSPSRLVDAVGFHLLLQ